VPPVLNDGEPESPSLGRGAPQATEEQRQFFSDIFRTYPQGSAQLLPEEGALRYGNYFYVISTA
jgi:hypothetical protein